MFELEQVQFEHNHLVDDLTGAPTPTNFYGNLVKAISSRKRSGGALVTITVRINEPTRSFKKDGLAAKKQLEEYEENLIKASKIIKKNLRLEDSYTRMAVNGFYILIAGDKSEITLIIERFKKLFADRLLYLVKAHPLVGNLTATEWLNEIDADYFA
jgi:GGDEF domain-containing protein